MRIARLLLLALVACTPFVLLTACSTDQICEDSCDRWDYCGDWNYSDCYDSCKDDGDWSSGYRDCLEDADCNEWDLDACDAIWGEGRTNHTAAVKPGSPVRSR